MKQTDLIVQKDKELQNLRIEIANLHERLNELNRTAGAQKELIKVKDNEINKLQDESNKSDKVIVKTIRTGNMGMLRGPEKVETTYVNMKDIVQEIRKDIEGKTKKNISDLENEQLDLEIRVETLQKEVDRVKKTSYQTYEESEEKLRKRYNKLIEGHREEIDTLKEDIQKIKKDKTEEQLKAKREEQVAELDLIIENLEVQLKEATKVGMFRRFLNKLFNIPVDIKANQELELAKLKRKLYKTEVELWERKQKEFEAKTAKNNDSRRSNPFYGTNGSYMPGIY